MLSSHAGDLCENLYADYRGWLVSWLGKRLRCNDKASDIVQDLFCRLVERPPSAIGKPRAFLATSAIRLLIDQRRRSAVEQVYLEALAVAEQRNSAASPLETYEAVETLTAIACMLEGMAERPRRAFLLNRLEGLGYAEIAAELGVSTSMVKQYMASALVHCYSIAYPPA
ncbi:sigma-70 family RNA polymerase sigma factor [Roseomonas gilardii]|uniref:Sigma-70 family RNA polymerase sigma factor n=1 Tax=Roseomonas gilardii TaxID=257708 RepID=A0ABU3MDH9_9PROT|nr:sigma-70 family RNA polymerase sigma factor [Roseomonas gilardii]MDT8330867.1 sigma-70 family RNA polymerase sigma factor [Roseomonas gilardii]